MRVSMGSAVLVVLLSSIAVTVFGQTTVSSPSPPAPSPPSPSPPPLSATGFEIHGTVYMTPNATLTPAQQISIKAILAKSANVSASTISLVPSSNGTYAIAAYIISGFKTGAADVKQLTLLKAANTKNTTQNAIFAATGLKVKTISASAATNLGVNLSPPPPPPPSPRTNKPVAYGIGFGVGLPVLLAFVAAVVYMLILRSRERNEANTSKGRVLLPTQAVAESTQAHTITFTSPAPAVQLAVV